MDHTEDETVPVEEPMTESEQVTAKLIEDILEAAQDLIVNHRIISKPLTVDAFKYYKLQLRVRNLQRFMEEEQSKT